LALDCSGGELHRLRFMIIGSSHKPFPVTCTDGQCFMGGLYQHGRIGEDKIPLYNLSVRVPNWNLCSGQPSVIPVFAMPNAQDACDGPIPCPGGTFCSADGNTYTEPCGDWIGVDDLRYTFVPGQLNTVPEQDAGSGYTRGTTPFDFTNLKVCEKRGSKSVQAKRSWHGTFGLTDDDFDGCVDTFLDCGGSVDQYLAYRATPPAEKFCKIEYDYEYHITSYDEGGGTDHHPDNVNFQRDGSGSGSVTVDAGTGILTGSITSSELTQIEGIGSLFTTKDITDGFDSVSGTSGNTTDGDIIFGAGFACHGLPPCPISLTFSSLQILIDNFNAASGGSKPPIYSNPDSYSESGSYSVPGYPGTHSFSFSVDITRTNTSLTWSATWDETIDNDTETDDEHDENTREVNSFSGTITLSNSNPSSNIYTDLKSLLAYWPLNDDLLYPWRTDGKPQIAPLVSRNEKGKTSPMFTVPAFSVNDMASPINDAGGNAPFASGWAPTYNQMDWFDPIAYQWRYPTGMNQSNSASLGLVQMIDGSILGKPNPAGYLDYFMWNFQNWIACCDTSGDTPLISWFTDSGGILVSVFNGEAVVQLPLNTTQWTNNLQSINKIPGAYLGYNDNTLIGSADADCPNIGGAVDAGYLWAQKYAEIKENFQAQNYARPAGADKFLYEETRVLCATNLGGAGAGSTWTITNYLDETPADGTDFTGTWGGPVVDGFYSVSSYAGGILTLGAKAYDVPDDWVSASQDDAVCFGKLRFPSEPSLLGRASVTVDASGKIFIFDSPQTNFGMSVAGTESIDIYDGSMTGIASSVTVKVFKPWKSSFAYSSGDVVTDGANGQICTTGGTSSGSAPSWNVTLGGTTSDSSVVWTLLFIGATADSNFYSPTTGYSSAGWVVIAGVKYEYNSNFPRGNCLVLDWTFDTRTSANLLGAGSSEYLRLTGVLDCSGVQVSRPTPNTGFSEFSQTQFCTPFSQCEPRVICITPNAESFANAHVIPFPETFTMDERYGSKWCAFVQMTMNDLYWQSPHTPCSAQSQSIADDPGDMVSGTDIIWKMDDGSCQVDSFDETTGKQTMFYPHAPQVEAEIVIPSYGMGTPQTDIPTLPSGFSLPWLSPVTNTTGDIAFPPAPGAFDDEGIPVAVKSAYGLRRVIEESVAVGSTCRFLGDYREWFLP
jgi:hypothetical protein